MASWYGGGGSKENGLGPCVPLPHPHRLGTRTVLKDISSSTKLPGAAAHPRSQTQKRGRQAQAQFLVRGSFCTTLFLETTGSSGEAKT